MPYDYQVPLAPRGSVQTWLAGATGVRQRPGAILVVAAIDIQTLVRSTVHNVARGRHLLLLRGRSGLARVQDNRLGRSRGVAQDVQAVGVALAAEIKRQRDGSVLELPDLVGGRGAGPEES